MPVVKNLMVRAGADFSPITKQAQRAQKSMQAMQQRVSRSCKVMQSAMNGLKRVMGALGVGLSIGAVISAGKAAKEAYDVQAEAEARLAQVMRNTMGARAEDIASIKALTSAQQELGVVGDEVQVAGAQELATYLSQRKSLEKLIPVMNDMIAQQYGYNATSENAVNIATMMGKVMDGQTGALRRYGYTFTEAQEAVLKYGNEAQRAATLAEVVSASVGGMNQALASTPTGRIQQLKNTLSDIKEEFGRAVTNILATFLPALQAVARVLADVATLANKIAQAIANVFGAGNTAQSAIVGYGGAASDAVGEITEATNSAAESAETLATAGFDTLNKLSGGKSGSDSGSSASSGSGGGSGISTIVEESGEAGETIGWLERGLQRIKELFSGWDTSKLHESFDRLSESVRPFVELVGDGLSWVMENVLAPLGKWFVEEAAPRSLDALSAALDFLRAVAEKLRPIWQWVWDHVIKPVAENLGSAITRALETITTVFRDLTALIKGEKSFDDLAIVIAIKAKWEDTKEKITEKWNKLTSGIKEKLGKIKAKWEDTKEKITQLWNTLTSGITEKLGKIKAKWEDTKEKITQQWNTLTSGITEKIGKIKAKWEDTKEKITQQWNTLTSGITSFTAPIRAKIATVWADLKKPWLDLIDPLLKLTIPIRAEITTRIKDLKQWINTDIIAPLNRKIQEAHIGSWYPLRGVQIPYLAQGGYLRANNPMLAVVGDNKTQGEIVSPEGKLATMAREAAAAALRGARMAMQTAADIRTPVDIPSALRAFTGPSGGFGLSIGGIGDEAMSLLQRMLRAIENGQVISVDRAVFGRLIREANNTNAKAVGAVVRSR